MWNVLKSIYVKTLKITKLRLNLQHTGCKHFGHLWEKYGDILWRGKIRTNASDTIIEQKITISIIFESCAPLALFDVSFKQRDTNPLQKRTKAHSTFHINVEWKEH